MLLPRSYGRGIFSYCEEIIYYILKESDNDDTRTVFFRLKAKLHMRMKLDEYDMKVEKNYNLYKQFMAVSRNLNKAKQDFQDEKQQKELQKSLRK